MRRLVLIGGGHAHLFVLEALAGNPLPGTSVTLVSPHPRPVYSGMLPGWIAGRYVLDQCRLPLDRLAECANVHFRQTHCVALDADTRRLACADGSRLDYDLLSIDCGSHTQPLPPLAPMESDPAIEVLPVRPLERFVTDWSRLAKSIAATAGSVDVAVVGDGAAALELALAIATTVANVRLTLVGTHPEPLPGFPPALRRRAVACLAERRVAWLGERRVEAFSAQGLRLRDGSHLPARAVLLATGSAAPGWLRDSGLGCDAQGYVQTGPSLQSLSHPEVFAAGDIAAGEPPRPKSGVFAVRAGPTLAANLLASLNGEPLRAWAPGARALYLIGTGDGRALAAWGGLSLSGAWAWRWKDRIDRRFIARFTT